MKYHNESHRMEIISMQSTLDDYKKLLQQLEESAKLGHITFSILELKGGVIKNLTEDGFLVEKRGNFYEITW